MNDRLCSIIIPTCNEGALLHLTVDSILTETDYPLFEIIVVDDGSTDGSCDRYQHGDRRVRVVRGENLGVACARNLGAEHAAGSFLVFIDAHCKVSKNWIARFVAICSDASVGLVGPTFTRLDKSEPRGCGVSWSDHTLDSFWFEPADTDQPYDVPLTIGACQAFRTSTFKQLGRYGDEFTKWGSEDLEICLRAWLLGYRVVADPTITVAHHFRETRNYDVEDRKILYNFLRMIHMHFSPKRIRKVIRAISPNPHLTGAMDDLYQSNVFEVRCRLSSVRTRDDDWFFKVFLPELD